MFFMCWIRSTFNILVVIFRGVSIEGCRFDILVTSQTISQFLFLFREHVLYFMMTIESAGCKGSIEGVAVLDIAIMGFMWLVLVLDVGVLLFLRELVGF
jgi:hypothetical protein